MSRQIDSCDVCGRPITPLLATDSTDSTDSTAPPLTPMSPTPPPTAEGAAAAVPPEGDVPSLRTLHSVRRIWVERTVTPPGASMLERLLARMDERYHVLAELVMYEIPEMQAFVEAAEEENAGGDEFSLVVGAVAGRLTACMDVSQLDRGYVRSGTEMQHRENLNPQVSGPSFWTSRMQKIPQSKVWVPLSLSTVLRRMSVVRFGDGSIWDSRPAIHPLDVDAGGNGGNGRSSLCPSVIINTGHFAWEDVQLIWELKPSSNDINSHAVLSDLIHKATEILHAQWHRRFVLAFLVCGVSMKMIWFDRSGVLVGSTIDIRKGGGMLMVKCILAGLVLSPPDVGLPMEFEHPKTTMVNGVRRLVVEVCQEVFVLGERIVSSPRGNLVCRGTVVHRARRVGGTSWDMCHKLSWPYTARLHEGYILEELQEVEGVVRLFAWDVPEAVGGVLGKADIDRDFQMRAVSASALRNAAAGAGTDSSNNQPSDFRPRELRQTVTAYVSDPCSPPTTMTLLRAWRALYVVVDAIAQRGWVHRDLSWTNVRITHPQGNPYNSNVSVTLIDFDLASRIIGPVPPSADRAGTPSFMPLHILCSSTGIRHQELHEDEAAFWIGFLAIVARTEAGYRDVKRLNTSRKGFEGVGDRKIRMLSALGQRVLWGAWFGPKPEGLELRKICTRVMQMQFGPLDIVYPPADERDEEGRRVHAVLHRMVVRGVVRIIDEGIESIERLRRAARQSAGS